jgi:GGDEF domain-containing protein
MSSSKNTPRSLPARPDSSDRWHCSRLLDIDHLARVNERVGQLGGNSVLSAVANVLQAEQRGATASARETLVHTTAAGCTRP